MSKVKSLKNTFDKLLAGADFETTNQLRYTVAEMMDDVINRIIEIQQEDEGVVKPKRKKPVPKDTIARLGPLSDAIKNAGKKRRGEVVKDEFLEGIMNRSKPKLIVIKHSDLTAAQYRQYDKKRDFKGRAAFVIELLQAQSAGQLTPTKGIFRCPCCDYNTTETGTYRLHRNGVTLRWYNHMDHMAQAHGVPPPEDFMKALMHPKYHSKIECR